MQLARISVGTMPSQVAQGTAASASQDAEAAMALRHTYQGSTSDGGKGIVSTFCAVSSAASGALSQPALQTHRTKLHHCFDKTFTLQLAPLFDDVVLSRL